MNPNKKQKNGKKFKGKTKKHCSSENGFTTKTLNSCVSFYSFTSCTCNFTLSSFTTVCIGTESQNQRDMDFSLFTAKNREAYDQHISYVDGNIPDKIMV